MRTSLSGRVGRRIPVSARTFAVHARLTRLSSRFTPRNLPLSRAIDRAFCQERAVRCDSIRMEAATPLPFSQVRVVGDTLRVDGLVVHDECAVRLASEADDPSALVCDAIEIGVRVLDREQTGANAEFVKTEFEKAARDLNVQFTDKARTVAEGMTQQLDEVFGPDTGSLSKALERHFSDDSSGSVQQRVRSLVGEVMAQARQDLLQQFSAADGRNPLADFKAASLAMIKHAAEQQDRNLTAMRDRLAGFERELHGLRGEKAAAA